MMTNRLLLTVREARQQLGGISQAKFYELVNGGDIELVKLGRRSFIPSDSVVAFVEKLRSEAA